MEMPSGFGTRVLRALLATILLCAAAAVDAAEAPPSVPRQVNVTADSAPGWIPSVELEARARRTASAFLAALDGGRAAEAYALLTPAMQHDHSLTAFSDDLSAFNRRAGPVRERAMVVLTWTKNPAQAPAPGVYAAIDLVSRFVNIDRHCGYLVLYQAPMGGDFRISRIESNFMDNASAKLAGADDAWVKLSANCPNYKPPLVEATGPVLDYPNTAVALAALKVTPGVVISTKDGWTVARDDAHQTYWSFPPLGHPAYPSAVRRRVVKNGDGATIDMNILCEATKVACDDLVRTFQSMNAQVGAH